MENQTAKCLNCGNTSDQKILISCVENNQPNWVCVSCLPVLVHGNHQCSHH